ncbi:MAG: SAM-dependent methyltransferase [Rickettsiales bacterium]
MCITAAKPYKPDFTAWFVLQGVVAVMNNPVFYDIRDMETLRLHQIMATKAAKARFLSRIIERLPYSWQYKIGEFVTNPGRLRHFYLRKKEIEKQATEFLAGNDVGQVVILGAGLDTLALRLAVKNKNTKFIEIDRDDSQMFKYSCLRESNVTIPTNIEFLDGDLRNPLSEILSSSKLYDSSVKTLWIAEGLLMFLDENSVISLFGSIKAACPSGSRCIFTSLSMAEQGSVFARMIQKLYLNKEKSPLRWSIPYDKVSLFFENLGFNVLCQKSCDMLHKRYISKNFNINHKIGDDIHIVEVIS